MFSFRRMPIAAMMGLLLTAAFVFVAVFAPWIAPYSNSEVVGDIWAPASMKYWLGTDNLGRDLLSRMISGTRVTLVIAGLATALSFSMGSILGFTAAVVGGWLDQFVRAWACRGCCNVWNQCCRG